MSATVSGSKSGSKPIVIARIQFLEVVGLKPLFSRSRMPTWEDSAFKVAT